MKSMNEMVKDAVAEVALVKAANPSFSHEQAVSWACDGIDELFELNNAFSASLRQRVLEVLPASVVGDVAPREQDLDRDDAAEFDEPVRDDEETDILGQPVEDSDPVEFAEDYDDYEPSPYDGTYSEE
jgi:hypothetical protein